MALDHIDLDNPDNFVSGTPHHWFKQLRREAPVHWHKERDGIGFWCLTKYEDVKFVSRNPQLFSSWLGGTNIADRPEEALMGMRMIMLNMDPPQHVKFRRIVQRGFTPQMTAKQEPYLRGLSRRIVDAVAQRGECEFVEELAAELPLQVICELMGVPLEDRKLIFELSNKLIGFDDPEFQNTEEDARAASVQMFGYAMKLAERYRREPADNLTTTLMNVEIDGEKLSEIEFCSFFLLLLVAGNETTRTVTTNGMRALLAHPEQLELLAKNPFLVPTAVEEFVRFDPAVHYFRRTATQDTEIRGKKIAKGQKVVLWYPSANRDEDVFSDPDRFDVTRQDNQHLAFGIGEHYCLGANLARLELTVIFQEMLTRLKNPRLAAPPRRLRSNFINGVKEMRIEFDPEHG
ncbi:MAG TPA: cytochrome P450 [Myxococcota bacterium]|nr:cytochrome P450 [Myxococcota bacterium]